MAKELPLIKTRTIQSFANTELLRVIGRNEENREVGQSYKKVLELVLAEYPEANTSIKCLQWYNSKLNKTGAKVPIRMKNEK